MMPLISLFMDSMPAYQHKISQALHNALLEVDSFGPSNSANALVN